MFTYTSLMFFIFQVKGALEIEAFLMKQEAIAPHLDMNYDLMESEDLYTVPVSLVDQLAKGTDFTFDVVPFAPEAKARHSFFLVLDR